ncbi:hypothetical protein [Diaphorobacter caeni]|uniref:hypothetical protein n=1 Tax=Diaphorobacter caeni TaxID=2784387 RepID=UPI001890419B|nr:hypothetical protein [Diaphorobacter caeni]MBF5007625.1 hypothetical protein [Diaphorobacter caeni]
MQTAQHDKTEQILLRALDEAEKLGDTPHELWATAIGIIGLDRPKLAERMSGFNHSVVQATVKHWATPAAQIRRG